MKDFKNLKIAYIGGGSRGWAYILMNDLAKEPLLGGNVSLYDIDYEAAKKNEIIGNRLFDRKDVVGKWKYKAEKDLKTTLKNADFVVISVLPGPLDIMESDIHYPEKYGIYQSVGDTTGPGGIIRALRTVPIFREFALAIKENCPNAWVINFTNPMTVCVRTLYKVFPEIKAIGCCHEVFSTQRILRDLINKKFGLNAKREDIKVNVVGVNHFTWLTAAKYQDMDLMPLYDQLVKENPNGLEAQSANDWVNLPYTTRQQVKFDLYRNYGVIAAAGDRHLAEFCPGGWYLHDKETVKKFGFSLTDFSYRQQLLEDRLQESESLVNGKEFTLRESDEESVKQIKALLGLGDFVTNINIPNYGQIPNNPIGAVVETNVYLSDDSARPIFAGNVPERVNALILRIIEEQEMVVEAGLTGNYELAFTAFRNNPNMPLPLDKARELFDKMLYNTKEYLPYYDAYVKK